MEQIVEIKANWYIHNAALTRFDGITNLLLTNHSPTVSPSTNTASEKISIKVKLCLNATVVSDKSSFPRPVLKYRCDACKKSQDCNESSNDIIYSKVLDTKSIQHHSAGVERHQHQYKHPDIKHQGVFRYALVV